MYFTGIIIAISTFLIIGLFHPIVIKTEYYFGTKPWWIWLLAGLTCKTMDSIPYFGHRLCALFNVYLTYHLVIYIRCARRFIPLVDW